MPFGLMSSMIAMSRISIPKASRLAAESNIIIRQADHYSADKAASNGAHTADADDDNGKNKLLFAHHGINRKLVIRKHGTADCGQSRAHQKHCSKYLIDIITDGLPPPPYFPLRHEQ